MTGPRGALLAALLLLAAVPAPADAQAGGPLGVRVIEDAPGDVVLANPSGTPIPASTDRNRFLDLLAVDVEEHPDGYFVHLWVAAFPPDPRVLVLEEGVHAIRFEHGTVAFEVALQSFDDDHFAYLASDPGGTGEFGFVDELDMTVDASAGRMSAFVPRRLLADRDGAPPFPGRALTGFAALSRGTGTAGDFTAFGQAVDASVYGSDEAAAAEGFALPVAFGAVQSGLARLAAERPFRASNGEAATFIFEVEATNGAGQERLYRLAAQGLPANWEVTFPQPELRLDASESRPVPVLLTVPFAHQHGRITSFVVELRDLQDPSSVGRVELGLHYTDPPQPAGHHPELYFHSRAMGEFATVLNAFVGGVGGGATMNTNPEDPRDQGADVSGSFGDIQLPDRVSFQWEIPLSPQLQMGLDADLARTGAITVPIGTTLPMPQAILEGRLTARPSFDFLSFDPEDEDDFEGPEEVLVATIPATPAADIAPAGTHTFESTVVPSEEADYVPYDPSLNLVLDLTVSFARPSTPTGVEAPVLKAGGRMLLPLLEYTDPVDDLFAGAAGLQLNLTDGAERRAPPGGSALVEIRASGPAGHYDLRAIGAEAGWVEVPEAGLHVNDNGVGGARVAVHVPADAQPGQVVDLVLEASGGPAGAVHSLVRLRVTVDPAAPDQEAVVQSGGGKGAPAPGAAAALAALAAVALARRLRG